MNAWISVKDKLPEYEVDVLVTDGKEVGIAHRWLLNRAPLELHWSSGQPCASSECDIAFRNDEITHWMPLPEPPEIKL